MGIMGSASVRVRKHAERSEVSHGRAAPHTQGHVTHHVLAA